MKIKQVCMWLLIIQLAFLKADVLANITIEQQEVIVADLEKAYEASPNIDSYLLYTSNMSDSDRKKVFSVAMKEYRTKRLNLPAEWMVSVHLYEYSKTPPVNKPQLFKKFSHYGLATLADVGGELKQTSPEVFLAIEVSAKTLQSESDFMVLGLFQPEKLGEYVTMLTNIIDERQAVNQPTKEQEDILTKLKAMNGDIVALDSIFTQLNGLTVRARSESFRKQLWFLGDQPEVLAYLVSFLDSTNYIQSVGNDQPVVDLGVSHEAWYAAKLLAYFDPDVEKLFASDESYEVILGSVQEYYQVQDELSSGFDK